MSPSLNHRDSIIQIPMNQSVYSMARSWMLAMTPQKLGAKNLKHFLYFLLGGGFKYVLFSPLFGEDEPILTNAFQMGWNRRVAERNAQYLGMPACRLPKGGTGSVSGSQSHWRGIWAIFWLYLCRPWVWLLALDHGLKDLGSHGVLTRTPLVDAVWRYHFQWFWISSN